MFTCQYMIDNEDRQKYQDFLDTFIGVFPTYSYEIRTDERFVSPRTYINLMFPMKEGDRASIDILAPRDSASKEFTLKLELAEYVLLWREIPTWPELDTLKGKLDV